MTASVCPCCGYNLARLEDFTLGDLHVSGEFGAVSWKGKAPHLTATDRLIVLALAMGKGRYISRLGLIEAGGLEDVADPDGQLSVLICRVRRRFREIDPGFDEIETTRGLGFRWKVPVDA